MNLEQRIDALEQELQVLKNQIQATLLDMQEFMLTNSFPALRADEQSSPAQPVAPQTTAKHPTEPTLPPVDPGPSHPRRQFSAVDTTPQGQTQEGEAQVRVNRIESVNDIMARQPRHDEVYDEPAYNSAPYSDEYDDPYYVDSDETPGYHQHPEPVDTRPVQRNGKSARTRQTPLRALQQQHMAFDLSALDAPDPDYDYPAELSGWVPPFLTEPVHSPESIPDADWANLYMLESWVRQRIETVGPLETRRLIERHAAEGRIAPLLRVMMFQLITIIAEQPRGVPAYDSYDSSSSTETSAADEGDRLENLEKRRTQDMVLRTIARLKKSDSVGRKQHG